MICEVCETEILSKPNSTKWYHKDVAMAMKNHEPHFARLKIEW